MVRKLVVLAALAMLCVTGAYAQGFSVGFYYVAEGANTPLVTTCGGATAIPDGRVVKIFWDQNNNGPDISDPQAPLCTDAPACEVGPPGTHNYNQFLMNGVDYAGGEGFFATTQNFISASQLSNPSIFYLRVYEPDATTVLWTSTTRTFVPGPQDVFYAPADWSCGATGPQCVVLDESE